MSPIEKEISKYVQILFPDGNYYLYWLYTSFVLVFPILLMTFIQVLSIINNGITISTDSFVAEMRLPTSYRCGEIIMRVISTLLQWCSYLWMAILVHTAASVVFDIYYINERRNDL